MLLSMMFKLIILHGLSLPACSTFFLIPQSDAGIPVSPCEGLCRCCSGRVPANVFCKQVDCQPGYVLGAQLQPHQLSALQWLRSMWVAKRPAVLADEQGLGKTASCIAYLSALLHEFHATSPVLVVVPLSMLGFWEGERGGRDCCTRCSQPGHRSPSSSAVVWLVRAL